MANVNNKSLITVVIVIAVAVAAYGVLTMPDQRSTGERLGDAVDAVEQGKGLGDAAEQLEKRTPGEKLGDAVKEATDNQ